MPDTPLDFVAVVEDALLLLNREKGSHKLVDEFFILLAVGVILTVPWPLLFGLVGTAVAPRLRLGFHDTFDQQIKKVVGFFN